MLIHANIKRTIKADHEVFSLPSNRIVVRKKDIYMGATKNTTQQREENTNMSSTFLPYAKVA